jgi:hypothetical protein
MHGPQRWPTVPTRANGQLAFGHYRRDGEGGGVPAYGVAVVGVRGARIDAMTVYLVPEMVGRLGLPPHL